MKRISPHITYKEAVRSNAANRLGVENTPDERQLERMQVVATYCFEPARMAVDARVFISSFFRGPEVNVAIGGSGSSFHTIGAGIDADADPYAETTNRELFLAVIDNSEFTELIYEYPSDDLSDCAWVHMALVIGRYRERKIKIKKKGEGYRLMTSEELETIRNFSK